MLLPAACRLAGSYLCCLSELYHVLIGLRLSIDTGFCTLYRQSKNIYDDESVLVDLALQYAHDLQVSARLGVHRHLQ